MKQTIEIIKKTWQASYQLILAVTTRPNLLDKAT